MRRALVVVAMLVVAAAVWWGTTGRAPAPTTPAGPLPPESLPPIPHGQATALVVLPDGLAVGGAAGGVSIRGDDGAVRHDWTAHAGPVRRLWLDGDDLYSAGADGSVARWRKDGTRLDRWWLPDHALDDADRGAGGVLVVGGDRGVVARLDGAGWVARGAHGRATFAVALSPDTREVLSGGADGRIARWAVDDGALIAERALTRGWVTALVWRAERRVVAGSDGTLWVWQGAGEDPAHTVAVPGGAIVALAVDGARAITGSEDGRARLVDLDRGVVTATLDPGALPPGPVTAVAIAGDRAFTGGRDDRIRAWRVTDGRHLATLPAVAEARAPRR